MDTDYYFVQEKVQKWDIVVQYIPTKEQVANILTKGLHNLVFVKHCHNLALGFSSNEILVSKHVSTTVYIDDTNPTTHKMVILQGYK